MLLFECDQVAGGKQLRSDEPDMSVYRNAVYNPVQNFYDLDPTWGLYSTDGLLIEQAAYRRREGLLIGQSETIGDAQSGIVDTCTDECLYIGPIHTHYGHYLVTSLARLWPLLKRPGRKVLVHSHVRIEDFLALPFIQETLTAMGISKSDIVMPTTKTRFTSVVVPSPSFQELSFSYLIHGDVCRHISRTLCGQIHDRSTIPVFLSKMYLNTGVWKFSNEAQLIEKLQRYRLQIAYPEMMTFRDQLAFFNRHANISGAAGSALHTSLFAQAPVNVIGLYHSPDIASNFALCDLIAGNTSRYLYMPNREIQFDYPGFHYGVKIEGVEGIADELFERISETQRKPSIGSRLRTAASRGISRIREMR